MTTTFNADEYIKKKFPFLVNLYPKSQLAILDEVGIKNLALLHISLINQESNIEILNNTIQSLDTQIQTKMEEKYLAKKELQNLDKQKEQHQKAINDFFLDLK